MGSTDWDGLFRVLSTERQRRVLVALLEHSSQENSLAVPEMIHNGDEDLETLQMELHHIHLPDLEDADFIRWDRENHQIQKGPRFETVRPILECVQEHRQEVCLR